MTLARKVCLVTPALVAALSVAACGDAGSDNELQPGSAGDSSTTSQEAKPLPSTSPLSKAEALQAFDDYLDRRAAAIEDYAASGRQGLELRQEPLLVSGFAKYDTFNAAVRGADLIVHATVRKNMFSAEGTTTALSVLEVWKGAPTTTLTISQNGGPVPTRDGEGYYLGINEATPILLAGDEAILFLTVPKDGSLPKQQYSTGQYRVTDGQIAPVASNPFSEQVRGLSVSEFESAVARSLAN